MPGRDGPAVRLRQVSKSFGNGLVVSDVSLAVEAGTCFGLFGPNGAGKTTTLKMIYGFWKPTSGTITVHGIDVVERPREVKKLLGIAPQENTLDPDLSVAENLSFHARYAGLPAAAARASVGRVQDLLGLHPYAGMAVAELSSGLRRRLVLARALLNNPRIVILDEPTRGLDRESRDRILGTLREMKAKGATIVLATHELAEAEALCDGAALMREGRILETGTMAKIARLNGSGNMVQNGEGLPPA